MTKYRNYGKKILAVVLTLATVITTGSFNIEALAANYSDAPNDSVESGGAMGEIYTNGSSNQKVDKVKFEIYKSANTQYYYTINIYENPTDENNPESGEFRKSIDGDVAASTEAKGETVEVSVGNDDADNPIVLTSGEKLGVSIDIMSSDASDIWYYDTDEEVGFTKSNGGFWQPRDPVVGTMLIETSTYSGEPADIDSISMTPSTTVVTEGDDPADLNVKINPNYKRNVNFTSNNASAVKVDSLNATQAEFVGTGQATVTASSGGKSATATFYVLKPTNAAGTKALTDAETYTGSAITKSVEVYCGTTKLTENTHYRVAYENNINPGEATLNITGLGDYAGYSKSYNFTINKGTITSDMVTNYGEFTVNTATGAIATATFKDPYSNLTYGTDFDATATYKSSTSSSVTYTVTVNGINNYTGGPITKDVTMSGAPGTPININSVIIAELEKNRYDYTGADITPKVHFYSRTATGKGAEITDETTINNMLEVSYGSDSQASKDSKKVTISGKEANGFNGDIELEYYVDPLNIGKTGSGVSVTLTAPDGGYVHNGGNEVKPKKVEVKYTKGDTTRTLTEGTDYTLSYKNNEDVGTATVTVVGKGNYTGSIKQNYEIVASFKKDAKVYLESYVTDNERNFDLTKNLIKPYNGSEYALVPSIELDDVPIEYGTDYTYTYEDNKDAGTAKIKVTPTPTGIYAGQEGFTITYTINPKQLAGSVIVNQPTLTYNGGEISLPDGTYHVYDGTTELIPGTDYDVSFTNNVNAGTAGVTATGKGNYTGSVLGIFKISRLSLTDSTVTSEVSPSSESYTGAAHNPTVIIYHNGNAIGSSSYTVKWNDSLIALGEHTGTVTANSTSNFEGSIPVKFTITPKSLSNLTYELGGLPCNGSGTSYTAEYVASYTGGFIKPSVTVYDNGRALTEGVDYTLSPSGNLNVGTALMRVKGKGGYQGSPTVNITFKIEKKSLDNASIKWLDPRTYKEGEYTLPNIEVRDTSASPGKELLKKDTDYQLVPDESAKTSGPNRRCKIVGIGNYTGETEVIYNVGTDLSDGGIELYLPDKTTPISPLEPGGKEYNIEYMGANVRPYVKMLYYGVLTEGTEYECDFSGGYSAGSDVTITVRGIGEFYGEISGSYRVIQKPIDELKYMTLSDGNALSTSDWTYDYDSKKKAVSPIISYAVPGTAAFDLTQGDDFAVSPNEVGPAVTDAEAVTITGRGNYSGTRTVNYKINPYNINNNATIIVDEIAPQTYTGSKIEPLPNVKLKLSDDTTIQLYKDIDYTVDYSHNVDVGTATVNLHGIGNYTGTNSYNTFSITKRTLTKDNTEVEGLNNVFYTGSQVKPDFDLYYNDILLTEDTDYTVTYGDNLKIGPTSGRVTIRGIGTFDGEFTLSFAIKGNIGKTDVFTITGINDEYTISDGKIPEITPFVTYNPGGTVEEIPSTYYTLKVLSTITPGDVTIALEGNGDVMAGAYYKTVKLIGNLSESGAVNITGLEDVYNYTGSEIKPHPTVTYNGITLVEGTHYKLEWQNNVEPSSTGKAKVIVKPADGNTFYVGQASAEYSIRYNIEKDATFSPIETYVYDGTKKEPKPTVTIAGATLDPVNDLEWSFGDNTNAYDKCYVTITGKGRATGSVNIPFTIRPIYIDNTNTSVNFSPNPITFTGGFDRPDTVTVQYQTSGSVKTLADTDYTIEWPTDNAPGEKYVTIRGKGNYQGNVTNGHYTVNKGNIADAVVTFGGDGTGNVYYAGGKEVFPEFTITFNGITLIEPGDYTKVITGNREISTETEKGKITFTGQGNLTGTKEVTFNVLKTDLSNGKVLVKDNYSTYTGSDITPEMEVYILTGKDETDKYVLKPKSAEHPTDYDYTVSYNGYDHMVDVGVYEIKVQGENKFSGTLYASYEVKPKSLKSDNITVTLNKDTWDYTGESIIPTVTVTDSGRVPGEQTLVEGKDYTISYENNTAAGSATSDNPPKVIVTGIGNYSEVVEKTFNIGNDLAAAEVTLDVPTTEYTYDGTEHKPEAYVSVGDKELEKGKDFNIEWKSVDDEGKIIDKPLSDAGRKQAIITGTGGYYGTIVNNVANTYYRVLPKVINDTSIIVIKPDLAMEDGKYVTTYNGEAQTPSVVVYDTQISDTEGISTNDYDVEYKHNTIVSSEDNPAVITIELKNNYANGSEKCKQYFYIKQKAIETGDFQASFVEVGPQFPYTGEKVEPEVKVIPRVPGQKALDKDTDFTVRYVSLNDDGTENENPPINAGKKKAIITGIGNYSGVVELPYNVFASLAKDEDTQITVEDQFYTGSRVEAPLTITSGGNTLVKDVDYAVTYTSDDNWQTKATATITPLKEYYADGRDVEYNIVFDPEMLVVKGYANEYTYTGEEIKPEFKIVTPSGQEVAYDASKITYTNSSTGEGDCTTVGTITATIPLNLGDKTCEKTVTYDIISKNIGTCYILPLYDNVYTGDALYPPVLIWVDDTRHKLLTEGVDYTLEYKNNVNPGVGEIIVTGKGNYTASVTKFFNIIAPKVLSLTGSTVSDTSVNLSWLRNASITGYEIYSEDSSVKYGSTTNTSYTVTGLNQGTNYSFKVRTFITKDGKTTFGEFSHVSVRTGLSAPNVTVRSLARGRTTLNWTPASGVSGYEIYRSISPNGTYNKIAVMPATAGGYSDSNLVSNGTYYYKVRAYQKVGENEFVYGYFSSPMAVTVR